MRLESRKLLEDAGYDQVFKTKGVTSFKTV